MRSSESPASLAQVPCYSTWNVGFGVGFFVVVLLNDLSTERRGS